MLTQDLEKINTEEKKQEDTETAVEWKPWQLNLKRHIMYSRNDLVHDSRSIREYCADHTDWELATVERTTISKVILQVAGFSCLLRLYTITVQFSHFIIECESRFYLKK